MKKAIILLINLCLIGCLFFASCEKNEAKKTSGDYGPNLHWSYDITTTTMTFTGTGEMPDLPEESSMYPWKLIGDMNYYYFHELTSIILPEGLTSIASGAFSFTNISSIEIPNSVVRVGRGAFAGATLKTITIGKNVKIIEHGAFGPGKKDGELITGTITVFNKASIPQVINQDGQDIFKNGERRNLSASQLYVPKASISKYKNAEGWKEFGYIGSLDE